MIMVRKNELACRDEWSHHLWESAADAADHQASPAIREPFPNSKVQPASEREIAAVVKTEIQLSRTSTDDDASESRDDIVLSELGATAMPARESSTELAREWPVAGRHDAEPLPGAQAEVESRQAIIKAREAYRERNRLQAARAAQLARPDRDSGPTVVDSSGATVTEAGGPEPVLPEAPDSFAPEATRSRATRESVPELGSPEIRPETHEPTIGALQVAPGLDQPSFVAEPEHRARVPQAVDGPDHRPNRPSNGGSSTGDRAAARHTAAARADRSRNGQIGAELPPSDTSRLDWFGDQPQHPDASMATGQSRRHIQLNDVDDNNIYDPAMAISRHDDSPGTQSSAAQADVSTDGAIEDRLPEFGVVANDDDVELMMALPGLELAAHLPRVCRTCRAFRPAETGDRGWCGNPWAFSHRRMVDPDEETPCESTLGHWWLPVDEVWSVAADVSSHGQPTPLLDAWLPHHREQIPRRRRS